MWFIKLGSSVRGPFTEEQLSTMLTRGEFSKSHLVSSDRQRWEQAGFLVDLIERKLGSTTIGRAANVPPSTSADTKSWYYGENGQKIGPFTVVEIERFISQRVILPETQVYSNQSRKWLEAKDSPIISDLFPKKQARNSVLMRNVIATLSSSAMIACGLLIWFNLGTTPLPPSPPVEPAPPPPEVVATPSTAEPASSFLSEEIEQKLTNTTGLVYLCTRVAIGNRVLDLTPLSSGTCFVVTKEGGVITNRHVVDFEAIIAGLDAKTQEYIRKERTSNEKGGGRYSVGIYVFFGELNWELEVLHMSDRYDLAVCKINRNKDVEYLSLSDSARVRRTSRVYAVGFPGLASDPISQEDKELKTFLLKSKTSISEMVLPFQKVHTITDGSVERITEFTNRISVVQHDAKISQGNSGGPLVRADGVVVGINTLGNKDKEGVRLGEYLYSPEISQMRAEIDEYVPGSVNWVE